MPSCNGLAGLIEDEPVEVEAEVPAEENEPLERSEQEDTLCCTHLAPIDYYDRNLCFASPDPANQNITRRVVTIMLAEEY